MHSNNTLEDTQKKTREVGEWLFFFMELTNKKKFLERSSSQSQITWSAMGDEYPWQVLQMIILLYKPYSRVKLPIELGGA